MSRQIEVSLILKGDDKARSITISEWGFGSLSSELMMMSKQYRTIVVTEKGFEWFYVDSDYEHVFEVHWWGDDGWDIPSFNSMREAIEFFDTKMEGGNLKGATLFIDGIIYKEYKPYVEENTNLTQKQKLLAAEIEHTMLGLTLLPFNVSNKVKHDKPPLGLTPKGIHKEQRLKDVIAAMKRYHNAGKDIPIEWLDELEELTEELYK